MKRTSKITSLCLAASLMISVTPTQTNCGVFGRFLRSSAGLKTVGLCLAIGSIFSAFYNKDQNIQAGPKTYFPFYLGNLGSICTGLAEDSVFCIFPMAALLLGKRRTESIGNWIQQKIDYWLSNDLRDPSEDSGRSEPGGSPQV